jgi:Ca-activated chloride channel family protein
LQTLGYGPEDGQAEPKNDRFLVADRADAPLVAPVPPAPQVSPGSETYSFIQDNPFIAVSRQPLSTFSIDVDTASYSNMRRFLTQNTRPPRNAVRVEELINYFSYDYAPPEGEDPFSANIEVASSPWNQGTRLVRIGLKGSELTNEERPPTNLVFLIDVSGSMSPANKLPLLKQGLAMLARQMREEDRVAMVVYAGNSGLVLPSTAGNQQSAILGALERLKSGGSTNGGAGIELAYNTAVQNFIPGGVNRVVLATDGDFNVGLTDRNALVNLIEAKAKSGVFLSVLGFGMGNLQDDNLEGLANKGNGNYAYIDTLREARKVLVEEMAGTLVTIAKDVKIQVEFNPAQVKAYRLVGYENRLLAARDFNDDTKDAGEIGAGHTVTALYEIVSKDGVFPTAGVDALKYQTPPPAKTEIVADQGDGELLTVKLRYKQPEGNTSKLLEFPVMDEGVMLGQASTDFRFATSVAGFGMLLRNGTSNAQGLNFEAVRSLAQSALGDDRHGYRAEFLSLVDRARQLITPQPYSSGAVTLKGIYIQGGGAVAHLQTPQGEFRLKEGARGNGYLVVRIDAGAGCVYIESVNGGQQSRICV